MAWPWQPAIGLTNPTEIGNGTYTEQIQEGSNEDHARKAPTQIQTEQKITLLVEKGSNPRRAGTRTGKVFGYYKTGMTVEQFLAKPDALMVDLVADVERGHVKVA